MEKYYLINKEHNLGKTYDEIMEIYQNIEENATVSDDGSLDVALSEDDVLHFERLATEMNVNIYIFTKYWSYPALEDYKPQDLERMLSTLKAYTFIQSPDIKLMQPLNELKTTNNYSIYRIYDDRMDSNYIDLFGYLDKNKDDIIYLRTNFESMQESVAIANRFLTYIGILATIIGTLAMLLISKKFTNPILELAAISKRMSDLDFDVKYTVKSQDEVGELGKSINILSNKLQYTISELKSANNELQTDLQAKIEVDEMRKEFLSNVSHELKTPIALIQGYAEGLKENINDDVESRDFYCEVIMDEADKMNTMVKKLLTLNQLECGNNQINFERFDIVGLI